LRTGYEQVRSVVAGLAGDWKAAHRVQLQLPATGVCHGADVAACCEPGEANQRTEAMLPGLGAVGNEDPLPLALEHSKTEGAVSASSNVFRPGSCCR
ncbi:MAG: hypothetical protein ACK42I_10570, partial [Thermomicrobium sp.]